MAKRSTGPPAPPTLFQEWLNPALKAAGITLKELARRVGMDYSALWKSARGNPAVYPGSRRPEYEKAVAIGRTLNDVAGCLTACEYPIADSKTVLQADSKTEVFDTSTGETMQLDITDDTVKRLLTEARIQQKNTEAGKVGADKA